MRAYVVADVFTDVPLAGNPVAVFLDGSGLSGQVMQRAARELNLSETVFVLPADGDGDGDGADADAAVRIFTPYVELPFAGHPVLGTAFVLASRRGADVLRLATGAGVVRVALRGPAYGEMEQPIPTWAPFDEGDELLAALGVRRPGLPVEVYDNGVRHAFVEVPDPAAVAPDMRALAALGAVGASCFAVGGDGAPVRTRMFGPGLGVAEDPATGSAAGPLAVHLARHGRTRFGERIEIRQGAEIGRPSVLHACAHGTAERLERVVVGGSAVIVGRGEYELG